MMEPLLLSSTQVIRVSFSNLVDEVDEDEVVEESQDASISEKAESDPEVQPIFSHMTHVRWRM